MLNTLRFLLTFDAPGQSRNFDRHRMHRHIAGKPLDKFQSSLLLYLSFGAIGSMHQISDCYYGQTYFGLPLSRLHLF